MRISSARLDECLCLCKYFGITQTVCSNLHALRANRVRYTRMGERGVLPYDWFVFAHKSNGGHWPPLQYSNHIAAFKKIYIYHKLCAITCGRPMNAPTGLYEQLQCYARVWYVFFFTPYYLHETGTAARRATGLYEQLQCYARASYVFFTPYYLHEPGTAARRDTGLYEQLQCYARA